ncbi:MAG: UPF0147 family protein [Candidatus Woesearchaeota archaeon]
MGDEKIIGIVQALVVIENDELVPKNVRTRVRSAICALNDCGCGTEVKIDKALEELSEIDNDPNLSSYTRSQIWNVVSALECK